MKLLNIKSVLGAEHPVLEEFFEEYPKYVALSHIW
jgi:hypothetical protein